MAQSQLTPPDPTFLTRIIGPRSSLLLPGWGVGLRRGGCVCLGDDYISDSIRGQSIWPSCSGLGDYFSALGIPLGLLATHHYCVVSLLSG